MRKKQNIIKIDCGSDYCRKTKGWTSRADEKEAEFLKTHPNAYKYYGDLRSEKKVFRAVYKLYHFAENSGRGPNTSNYRSVRTTYVEE